MGEWARESETQNPFHELPKTKLEFLAIFFLRWSLRSFSRSHWIVYRSYENFAIALLSMCAFGFNKCLLKTFQGDVLGCFLINVIYDFLSSSSRVLLRVSWRIKSRSMKTLGAGNSWSDFWLAVSLTMSIDLTLALTNLCAFEMAWTTISAPTRCRSWSFYCCIIAQTFVNIHGLYLLNNETHSRRATLSCVLGKFYWIAAIIFSFKFLSAELV